MKQILLVFLLMASVAHGAERPNVILIMADDLGYEGLACNGGTSYETPVFDRLARQGMRFTHCYSQRICTPSRNKIMTGRSNARNYRKFGDLDPAEITFGTLMRDVGYRTAIAGKWQLTGSGGLVHGTGTTPKKCGFEQSCMWAYERDVTQVQADAYYISYAAYPNFGIFVKDYIRGRRYLALASKELLGTELTGEAVSTGLFEDNQWIHITIIKSDKDLFVEFRHPEKKPLLCRLKNEDKPAVTHGRVGLRLMPGRMSQFKNIRIDQSGNQPKER